MEITPIGWILLPLGLVLFLFQAEFLYCLTIFFLPFSATAIANLGSRDSSSGVQASMFFGVLWCLKELPRVRTNLPPAIKDKLRTPIQQLGMFFGIVLLSLAMPLWINGHLVIDSAELAENGSAPLYFTTRHITQSFYLLYGMCLAVSVASHNCDFRQFMHTLKVFIISGIFVSLWGVFQFFCPIIGLDYPAYIFNTSATESAMGYTQEIRALGLSRISSVATEPSMFAQCMLVAIVIGLFAIVSNRPIISKLWDRVAAALIFAALLMSTSTTAYLGLGLVFVCLLCGVWFLNALRRRYVLALVGFATASLFLYIRYVPAQDIFESMVLGKNESYSGLSRVNSVLLASRYFLQYPILGVGWGSVTSHDLVFKLLSNTGILGLTAFSLFLWTQTRTLFRTATDPDPERPSRIWPICILVALVIVTLTSVAGDFAFTFGHVWFVLGLAMCLTAYRAWEPMPNPSLAELDLGAGALT